MYCTLHAHIVVVRFGCLLLPEDGSCFVQTSSVLKRGRPLLPLPSAFFLFSSASSLFCRASTVNSWLARWHIPRLRPFLYRSSDTTQRRVYRANSFCTYVRFFFYTFPSGNDCRFASFCSSFGSLDRLCKYPLELPTAIHKSRTF